MPSETQETDIPLWYKAQWGGDELRKRNGKQSKGKMERGAGDRKEGWH